MTNKVEFTWDENKRLSNLRKHDVLFEEAVNIFRDERRVIKSDKRYNYGEERLITYGRIKGRVHAVVYVDKGNNVVRIISARKANKREVRRYGQNC